MIHTKQKRKRSYPTLRELMRGSGKSAAPRAPWYSGYPSRATTALSFSKRKKGG